MTQNTTNKARIGLENENSIITYLNQKKFVQLDEKWRKHVETMFPFVGNDDIISCRKFPNHHSKPDIIVKVRHSIQYVSIKSGKNPSIHMEEFYSFSKFLRKIGVSERTIHIISFYHFGETDKLSKNGEPFTKEELQENFGEYFLQANKELDKVDIIERVVDRTVFRGVDFKRTPATFLYYGSVKQGILLSKENVYESVLSHREHENRPIHFGSLNYQPAGRKRNSIDFRYSRIKWPLLAAMFYENNDK